MTEKLYDLDPYLTEFDTKVTSVKYLGEGEYAVILEKTLFFPEEGGQTPDKGTLNEADVLNVILDGDNILHVTNFAFEIGDNIHGVIDWKHRFSNMQMHSGEHIFSGLVHSLFRYDNVGFHLSDNAATMDYNGKLNDSEIEMLEYRANEIIWSAVPIKAFYPDEASLEKLDYRSKAGIKGDVRLVEIEGVDLCACCAPHVRNTSEVGMIKIVKYENYKSGVRLHFLCGRRAYEDYLGKHRQLSDASSILSVPISDINAGITRLLDEYNDARYTIEAMKRDAVTSQINQYFEHDFDADKQNVISWFLDDTDPSLMKFVVNSLKEMINKRVCVFMGNEENGFRFIIEDDNGGLDIFLNQMKRIFAVKGGGKPTSIQGTVETSRKKLEAFLNNQE